MRTADGQKLLPLAFKQHAPRCDSIQRHPSEHEEGPEACPVFQKNDEVVPKIEIRLERAGCIEGAST